MEGWRKILNGTHIHIVKLTSETSIEDWIRENVQTILDFYERNNGAKGAIIVNSPMTAKRIKKYFQELTDAGVFHLSFAENTGLTKDKDSLAKDLLIGTSNVDIGVDFEINFLIFESIDEGTFIQRLGRLGRHNGYEKDGKHIKFSEFTAYAMLPKYSYERLEAKLQGNTELDRETFIKLIKGQEVMKDGHHFESGVHLDKPVFTPVTQFNRYTKCWGVLQTAHILNHTKTQIKSQHEFAMELEEAYNHVFDVNMQSMIKRYYATVNSEEGKTIFKELISFRGTSPFDCAMMQRTIVSRRIISFRFSQIPLFNRWTKRNSLNR